MIEETYGPDANAANSPLVKLFATEELAKAHIENTKSDDGVLLTIKIAELGKSRMFKLSAVLNKFELKID